MDFKNDLQIDQDALDVEWVRQPSLYMDYAEASILADTEAKKAKDALELIEAKQFKDIVLHSDKKPSDSSIRAEIMASPEYQDALNDLNQKTYESKVLSAVVKAFEQRKSALENLVKLWGAQYFSSPKEEKKEEGPSIKDKIVSSAQNRQRGKLNKKR